MDDSNKRYIITGGSGSGKTTLMDGLSRLGYRCFPEVSRILIREQQETEGDLLPWRNLDGFAEECFRRMKRQMLPVNQNIAFYDRGIPDIIAYLLNANHPVPEYLRKHADYYTPRVFLCPPWKKIFKNDPQRPESFEESKSIHSYLKQTYLSLGFQIIQVPKLPVQKRIKYIRSSICV